MSMRFYPFALIGLLGPILVGVGCNNGGISRQEVSGSVAKGQVISSADVRATTPGNPTPPSPSPASPPATPPAPLTPPASTPPPAPTVPPAPSNPGGGAGAPGGSAIGSGNFSLLLDQCTAKKQAWPAVIGGQVWMSCGDNLVDWCCTRGDAKAQFPSLASELDRHFAQLIDTEKLSLYHCSVNPVGGPDGKPRYTLHLGKVEGPMISYQTLTVLGVAPTGAPPSSSPCRVVRSLDIKIR
jgi:hypothetical protein